MRNVGVGLCLFLLLIAPDSGGKTNMKDMALEDKVAANLLAASIWIVESGIRTYHETGNDGVFRYLKDQWGAQLWVAPSIGDQRHLALFSIKARGIYHDVHVLYRKEVDRKLYEYWIVKIASREWANTDPQTIFIVAKADSLFGRREILLKTDHFFQSYPIDSRRSIALPLDDLRIIYDMEPWHFPASYGDSVLARKRVIIGDDGKYREAAP